MAASETEEIDVAKEFNLLPVIVETIQALHRTSDPQELTKKVFVKLFSFRWKRKEQKGTETCHAIRDGKLRIRRK